MTILALAAIATAAIPTATACYSTNPVLNYSVRVVPGQTVNFADDEASDSVAFAKEEADDSVAFAQHLVDEAPLASRPSPRPRKPRV